MAKVIFSYGTQAQYDALASKNDGTMYFITDTRRIYKGEHKVSDVSVRIVDVVPTYESALEDVMYVVITADDVGLHVKDVASRSIRQVGGGTIKNNAISSIEMFDENILFTSKETDGEGKEVTLSETDDSTIPTSGAVVKAIKEELADYVE